MADHCLKIKKRLSTSQIEEVVRGTRALAAKESFPGLSVQA
jgi:hypothetical protein